MPNCEQPVDLVGSRANHPMQPTSDISEHGWAGERTVDGGARIQRSEACRAEAVACSLGMLLLVVPMAILTWWIASRFFDGWKEDWLGLLFLLIPISVCGVMGLMAVPD